jgi:DNA-binding HxlR family transcriptional regulator
MKRKCLENSECAVARSLDVIGDWWSLLILREVFAGKVRFSEIQKSLGVAKNILSARLRKLLADGIFELVPAADGSSFREYQLTDKGRGLSMVIMALRQWGESFLCEPEPPQYMFVDKAKGKPIKPLELRSADGRKIKPQDVRLMEVE